MNHPSTNDYLSIEFKNFTIFDPIHPESLPHILIGTHSLHYRSTLTFPLVDCSDMYFQPRCFNKVSTISFSWGFTLGGSDGPEKDCGGGTAIVLRLAIV